MIKKWLAFDIGTTSTKAALVDKDGCILRMVSREYPTNTAEGGVMEQNAIDWWQAALEASHELEAANEVEAIALTGQMQDLILLDATGEPMRPVILYSDTRARAEADEVIALIGSDQLRALTGNDQDAGGLLAKLLWLRKNEGETLGKARHLLLGAADYLAFKMTSRAVSDTTTASTTGLLNIATCTALDDSVFAELGLNLLREDEAHLLPEITSGGTSVGTLTSSAAEALGLQAGIPVHHGPGDAGATTLGAGSGEAGAAYLYLGTSGWVAFTSPDRADPAQGVITLAHPHPGHYIQVAPLLTAGGNLEWVRDLFHSDDYDSLIKHALQRPSISLLYLPYLNGERSPIRDPLARGAFVGIDATTNKADLYRAVLEGVIYAYRHAIDALMPVFPEMVTLTGGGTRSQAWCQLFADILSIPVAIFSNAENVGIRGAVLAAQVTVRERDNFAASDFLPVAAVLKPQTETRSHFDQKYQLFRKLYPVLKPIYIDMASLWSN